jgi:hypothetical protein
MMSETQKAGELRAGPTVDPRDIEALVVLCERVRGTLDQSCVAKTMPSWQAYLHAKIELLRRLSHIESRLVQQIRKNQALLGRFIKADP